MTAAPAAGGGGSGGAPGAALAGSRRYRQLDAHIGEGTYGKVEKARDLTDGAIVAIKKVLVESPAAAASDVTDSGGGLFCAVVGVHFTVLREIKIMRELHHPNIIEIKDVYVDGDFVCLVMPHMATDLRYPLNKRVRFSEAQTKCILRQILTGLAYLHSQWYLHRDLAPANVFIDGGGVCKLADFGLARSYGSPRPSAKTARVVTLWYRAPELLYGAKFYQDKIDVWSAGCIFGEMLLGGKPLFPGQNEMDQLARIFELLGTPGREDNWRDAAQLPLYIEFAHSPPRADFAAVFPAADAHALDLLRKLLALDPMKRPSAAEALEHAYFTEALPLACQPHELPLQALGAEGGG